jgi:uncharacterized protein (TIGR03437 family)
MKKLSILLAAVGLSGGLAFAQRPVISANGVQDAASYTVDVAQGSVFVVKGTNLCAAGFVQASLPLPTTLNGVRISFTPTAGGSAVDAYMVYTYNQGGVTQLSAILPSTVATGAYNVTVSNNGSASDAARVNVVARKYGIITVNSSGAGRAVIQNYVSASQLDLNRFTTGTVAGFSYSPAKPGQTLILWGTGLGPISAPDNQAPGAVDLRAQVSITVNVGGVDVTPAYAGRSPQLPGADQINFVLPANVATGCSVPVYVKVGAQTSNAASLAIASGSSDACSDAQYSRETLGRLDQGGNLVTGSFVLSSFATSAVVFGFPISTTSEGISGSFSRYSADQIDDSRSATSGIDSCFVVKRLGNQSSLLTGTPPSPLDAGTSLTLNGPNVSNKSVPRISGGVYGADLSSSTGGIPGIGSIPGIGGGTSAATISAGTYTLSGAGGADIGSFSASVTVGNKLTVGNITDTISRNSPLTVTWTGGGNDLVSISGVSGTTVAGSSGTNPTYDATVFICTTTASRGSFTVPSSILQQLPATPANALTAGTGIGALTVLSTTQPTTTNGTFTAPLTAGGNIDAGFFISTVGSLKTLTWQ